MFTLWSTEKKNEIFEKRKTRITTTRTIPKSQPKILSPSLASDSLSAVRDRERRQGQDITHTVMGYICQGWQLWSDHPFYTQKFIDVDVSSDGYTYHPSSQGEIEIDEDVDSEDEDEGEDDGEDGDEDENEEYVDEDKNNDEDAG